MFLIGRPTADGSKVPYIKQYFAVLQPLAEAADKRLESEHHTHVRGKSLYVYI